MKKFLKTGTDNSLVNDMALQQLENTLKEREEELATIYENVPILMLMVDEERRVHKVNRTTEMFTGRPFAELSGLRGGEALGCVHADDDPAGCGFGPDCRDCPVRLTILDTFHTDVNHDQVEASRTLRVNGEAQDLTFLLSTTKLKIKGEPRVLVTLQEITALKRNEVRLKETMARLKRSNEDLEQFAFVASHDLQEPLRMIASYVDLLAERYKDKLDDDAREFMGFASEGAARMQALIDDLLRYSRLGSSGKGNKLIDPGKCLDAALGNLLLNIEETGAEVTRGELPKIMANGSHLTQLFQNLIGNAINFRGEEPPRIYVSASETAAEWEFSVADNGIGIRPEQQERIFLIFQRLHPRGTYPGNGIGLATSKRIAEQHGGRIRVESEPGKGSKFFFTIAKEL